MFYMTMLFLITLGGLLIALLIYFDVIDFDRYYAKKISKNISKNNYYKAISLYVKHNSYYYEILAENDNFNDFIKTFYLYLNNENIGFIDNYAVFDRLIAFYAHKFGEWHKVFNFAITTGNITSREKNIEIKDDLILLALYLLAMQDDGLLKIKDGKEIDFRNLAVYGKNQSNCLFDIMDDCKVKDIMTKVKIQYANSYY